MTVGKMGEGVVSTKVLILGVGLPPPPPPRAGGVTEPPPPPPPPPPPAPVAPVETPPVTALNASSASAYDRLVKAGPKSAKFTIGSATCVTVERIALRVD